MILAGRLESVPLLNNISFSCEICGGTHSYSIARSVLTDLMVTIHVVDPFFQVTRFRQGANRKSDRHQ